MIACRFLLASLHMDAILGEVTIRQRRKKLEEMARGNGLGDAYTGTLTRIKMQEGYKSLLGLKALMWVLYSERPLRAEELCHALGVEIGSIDQDHENIAGLWTILSSSLGLLKVEGSSSTVRLVHFTLQEHLLSDPTLFSSPHSTISEVCLTYLNFGCVTDLSPTRLSAPLTLPLLEYASCYWGNHTRKEMTENVKILALRLLNGFDGHISVQLMLLRYSQDSNSGPYFNGTRGPRGFTGLHTVAFFGIVAAVAPVLEMKEWDVNATDGLGSTAIAWAAWNGHEGVVKELLECEGINPDHSDARYGRTAFSLAAGSGHEGIVKMLLAREDVDPDRADTKYGRTPLSWAAERGHEEVVKMLLERDDVNPDLVDSMYGRTPSSWAAESGYEGVVKIFLERTNAYTGIPGSNNQPPPSLALPGGHDRVVKIISERDNANSGTPAPDSHALPTLTSGHGGTYISQKHLHHNSFSTDIADPGGQPTVPSVDPGVLKPVFDYKDSVSGSRDRVISLTEPSSLPPPPSIYVGLEKPVANWAKHTGAGKEESLGS